MRLEEKAFAVLSPTELTLCGRRKATRAARVATGPSKMTQDGRARNRPQVMVAAHGVL